MGVEYIFYTPPLVLNGGGEHQPPILIVLRSLLQIKTTCLCYEYYNCLKTTYYY